MRVAKSRSGKRVHKRKLSHGGHRPARANTPPQRGHGLGVRTDPGSNGRAHGATSAHIGAQVDVRPLKVHHASSAWQGDPTTMPKEQLMLGRPGQGTADLNKSGGLATVPIDNHATSQQHIRNNDTCTNNVRGDVSVPTENTTEARVIHVCEVRRHSVVHWEGMNLTPNTTSNIFNGKHSRGSRGLPKVTRFTQSTPDIDKRWCKRHIEDEVRQTTARARAVDSPGDITLPCDNEPC